MSVVLVVSTDLWGKKLPREVAMGVVVTLGNLSGVIVALCAGMPDMWVRFPSSYSICHFQLTHENIIHITRFQAWYCSIDKAETTSDWQEYFSQLQDIIDALPDHASIFQYAWKL